MWKIEVKGDFGGQVTTGWRTLGLYDTCDESLIIHENVILSQLRAEQEAAGIDWAAGDEDNRKNAPKFRIVEC